MELAQILTKTGKLNARIKITDKIENDIRKMSSFLPDDASFYERVYCLSNNIVEIQICKYCGNKKPYRLYRGYSKTCGSNGCGMSLRYDNEEYSKQIGLKQSKKLIEYKHLLLNETANNLIAYAELTYEDKPFNINGKAAVINVLSLLAKTAHLLPVVSDYRKIKAEYKIRKTLLKSNALPKCVVCGIDHTNLPPKTTCSSDVCVQRASNIRKLKLQRNKIAAEIAPFEIVDMPDLITLAPVKLKCELGHEFERWLQGGRRKEFLCPTCYPYGSSLEVKLCEILNDIGITNIITNSKKIIAPYEIDIYLPDHNYAIEVNGDYWHSFGDKETRKEQKYHQNKFLQCRDKGIKLIQLSEYLIVTHLPKVIKKLKHDLIGADKVFGRKCDCKIIDKQEANAFLDTNHFQNGSNHSSIHVGLYHKAELISVMTFGKPRFNSNFEWEIIRLATIKNVIGGTSKMFSKFVKTANPKSVISYSDNCYGDGAVYKKLGFTFDKITDPSYMFSKNGIFYSRFVTQKHKLAGFLGDKFDNTLTEAENMFNAGYRRIWDAGTTRWIWMKNL